MRIIIIEDTVYRCSEKLYQSLIKKQSELKKDKEGYKKDWEMQLLIENIKTQLKRIGVVEFDWRL